MNKPTDDELDALWRFEASKNWDSTLAMRISFARAIEAEVRKDDEALIWQLMEALEQSQPYVEASANGKRVQWWGAQLDRAQDAINAARARLEQP